MSRLIYKNICCAVVVAAFLFYAPATEAGTVRKRIISLTPASTETLFALGLDEEIVGISTYCNRPESVKEKERVGSFSSPNIEKIISLKPDLVILTGMEQQYLKEILLKLKIDYLTVDPSDLRELTSSIREIGDITGKKAQAERLAGDIESTIWKLKQKVSRVPAQERPSVYIEIWHDPIMTAGKNSFVNDMIETAGGKNIGEDLRRAFSKIDPEFVILSDPEIIILTYMKDSKWIRDNLGNRIGWQDIDALKERMVFNDIDPDLILRPGPGVGEGLLELYERFYEK